MDVVRFHREHRRTVFPTFLMAKQKIVWVISSTIIKYSLGELYQGGFQPISARVEPRLWLVQIWRHTSVFKRRIENLTNVSFVKLSKLFCSFMRVKFSKIWRWQRSFSDVSLSGWVFVYQLLWKLFLSKTVDSWFLWTIFRVFLEHLGREKAKLR